MSRLELEVLGREGERTALPTTGALVLGRSAARAGLVLDANGVDEAHAAIGRLKDGNWALKDLGSSRGTFVNGERVASVRLSHGDVLTLGEAKLRVIDPGRPTELVVDTPEFADAVGERAAPAPMPERLGGFRIQKRLGQGGMGDVYLAVQESLNRPVALKVLSPRLDADEEFVRRFEIEARAAAALNHSNVVVVHDVGVAEEHHYLAMEYMDRGCLEERLGRDGPLPWRDVLDILHDAASGLVYAEERGIVHRDIKPANLMQNAAGATKIADLGLATSVEGGKGQEAGKVFGTPHFISPEQARGEAPDHRSDLYSLGATLYRLLSGRTLFEGRTTRDIVRAQLKDEPIPLEERVAGIPPELTNLVARLLAKNPDGRPASASAVVAEASRLRAAADHGTPVGAGSERRTWIAAALVVGVVTAVLSGLYVGGALGGGDPDPVDPGGAGGGPDPVAPVDVPDRPDLPDDQTNQAGPADDDEVRLAEREAELDLRELELRGLPRPELRDELRALAQTHAGTAVAERARVQADRIDAELATETAQAAERTRALTVAREGLLALPAVSATPPSPADALMTLAAAASPPDVSAADWAALREEVAAELLALALEHARAELDLADEAQRAGDFERVESLLMALTPVLMPVPPEVPLVPAGLGEHRQLGREVAQRFLGLADARVAFLSEAATRERSEFAAALSGANGLERSLRDLDLGAARDQMDALAGKLVTPHLSELAGAIALELSGAAAVMNTLIAAWNDGGWRRSAIIDPRDRSGSHAETEAVDGDGLRLAGGDVIPWGEFSDAPAALLFLYRSRLAREWSEDEARGIATILRISGALRAIEEVQEVLTGRVGDSFREAEALAVEQAFDPMLEWAGQHGLADEVEDEARAGRELARACLALDEERYSEAAARIAHLLAEYPASVIVLLLSDGTVVEQEIPPKEPERPRTSPAAPDEGGGPQRPAAPPDSGGEGDGESRTPGSTDSAARPSGTGQGVLRPPGPTRAFSG